MKKTIFVLLFIFASIPVAADTIFFKKGTRLDVGEVWTEDDQVCCEMYGSVATFPANTVERIERSSENKKPEKKQIGKKKKTKKEDPGYKYHIKAIEHAGGGEWGKAIDLEKKACEKKPDNWEIKESLASFYRGYAAELRSDGKFDSALDNLKEALKLLPDSITAKKAMSLVYLDMAYEALSKNNNSMCRRYLNKAKEMNSDNPSIYLLFGQEAYKRDENRIAKKYWQKALILKPDFREAKLRLDKLNQEEVVEDNYKTRDTGNFILKFEREKNLDLAESAISILNGAYKDVGQDFGIYPKESIAVIVYPRSSLRGLDYFPDWAAGVYDGKIRVGQDLWKDKLFVKAVLYHEYTHAIVNILGGYKVPLWLNEGLAEYEASRFMRSDRRKRRKMLLKEALKRDMLFPFDRLSGMNLNILSGLPSVLIELVYVQSESFVIYLVDRYSLYDLKKVLILLGKGKNIHDAVRKIMFVDLDELIQDWKEQI